MRTRRYARPCHRTSRRLSRPSFCSCRERIDPGLSNGTDHVSVATVMRNTRSSLALARSSLLIYRRAGQRSERRGNNVPPWAMTIRELLPANRWSIANILAEMVKRDLDACANKLTIMGFGWAHLHARFVNTACGLGGVVIMRRSAPMDTGVPYPLFCVLWRGAWILLASFAANSRGLSQPATRASSRGVLPARDLPVFSADSPSAWWTSSWARPVRRLLHGVVSTSRARRQRVSGCL
jgi:hypothetical protein